jgi:hypothetical protein
MGDDVVAVDGGTSGEGTEAPSRSNNMVMMILKKRNNGEKQCKSQTDVAFLERMSNNLALPL